VPETLITTDASSAWQFRDQHRSVVYTGGVLRKDMRTGIVRNRSA
jgi:hypothetical protein